MISIVSQITYNLNLEICVPFIALGHIWYAVKNGIYINMTSSNYIIFVNSFQENYVYY